MQVSKCTGHAVSGVCPFANPKVGVHTYLDVPLQRFDTGFPTAGSGNSAIKLTCGGLAEHSHSPGWFFSSGIRLHYRLHQILLKVDSRLGKNALGVPHQRQFSFGRVGDFYIGVVLP